jgi:hypothetical protein
VLKSRLFQKKTDKLYHFALKIFPNSWISFSASKFRFYSRRSRLVKVLVSFSLQYSSSNSRNSGLFSISSW